MEYIALRSGIKLLIDKREPVQSLKQQALFFNRIGILNLEDCLEFDLDLPDGEIQDIQWLIDNGLIFNLDTSLDDIPHNATTKMLAQLGVISSVEISQLKKEIYKLKQPPIIQQKWEFATSMFETVHLRLLALKIEAKEKTRAIPFSPLSEFLLEIPESKKTDVIKAVIKELPLPNVDTPWEKILDYRNDPDTQKSVLALRVWAGRLGEQNLSAGEIEDQLRYSINEYQKYMNTHKIKSVPSIWEFIIKTPLEALENIATLKFSKLADPIFIINKQQIALMEAEINAPEKEIAYIVKTNTEFSE